ncbi:MAG: hypothetical protein ACRDNO_20360 [Trebonia sp.]
MPDPGTARSAAPGKADHVPAAVGRQVLDEVGAHHAACPDDQCCLVGHVNRSFIVIS